MHVAHLFQAISQAILISLAQGLIIYLLIRLALTVFKGLSSSWRYNLLYSSMIMILLGFIIALFNVYSSSSQSLYQNTPSKTFAYSASLPLSWNTLISNYAYWISMSYLSGIIIQSVILLVGYQRLKFAQRRDVLVPSQDWLARLKFLQSSVGIPQHVNLHFSGKVLIPFTAGFIKPVILFPLAMINHLSIEQVESILLHELAHIKRHDYLLNLLQRVMEIILFFNPITWLLAKQIRTEREFSCDDLVLRHSSQPATYARALALIEEHRLHAFGLAMAVSGSEKYDLLTRIKKITNMKTTNSNPQQRLIAFLSVLAIGLSLAWIVPSDGAETKKESNAMRQSSTLFNISDTIVPPPTPQAPKAPANPPAVTKQMKAPQPPKVTKPDLPIPPAPPAPPDTNELKKFFNSKEWKKQMEEMKVETEKMKKQFDSPEWKKQMADMKVEAEKMKKQFDGPEWKKQMEDMKLETEKMKKQFDSPEWRKQMADMKAETEKMKKQFDSPEWKKQMADMKTQAEKMKKQFESPEWKKKMSELELKEKN